MNKTVKYAQTGALIGGIGGVIYNLYIQFEKKEQDPSYQFNWGMLLRDALIGVGGGALVGAGIGAFTDHQNAQQPALDTTAMLGLTAGSVLLDKRSPEYRDVAAKATQVTRLLQQEFGSLLIQPVYRTGSTQNGTALADDFDIDLALEFRPGTFSSTQEMYNSVYECLDELDDNDLIGIRRQNKSLGVRFQGEAGEYKVDVVPIKRSKTHDRKSTAGYLHKESPSWFEEHSRTKTDIVALSSVPFTEIQKELLVLLKNWRNNYEVPIGTHLLKSMIKDAYACNKGRLPRDKSKKLILVVGHIRDSIHTKRLVSVENTNNIVTDIPESDKEAIYKACKKVVEDYEYQPNSVVKYFGWRDNLFKSKETAYL